MENNRTILAVVLIVLLWSAYSLFFAPQGQVPPPPIETKVAVQVPATTPEVKPQIAIGTTQDLVIDKNQNEVFVSVTTQYFDIKLSSVGGAVNSIVLNKYKETNSAFSPSFILFDGDKLNSSTLKTSGSDGIYLPANLNYTVVDNVKNIEVLNNDKSVTFVATTDDFTVYKKYTFHPVSYAFDVEVQLVSNKDIINGKLNLSLISPWDKDAKAEMYSFIGAVTYNGEELAEDKSADLEESPKIYKQGVVWSGYTSKYFFKAISPGSDIEQLFISAGPGYVENRFTSLPISIIKGENATFSYSSYFGPKQDEYLVASGHHFEDVIDYGFFHPLSKPLMVLLKFFYSYIGNYGFAVILLTICIKLIFWPLTQKSYKSMKGMQKLQPEMKKMREKYGKDKQKLNQEMMSFYKDNKVNPLGGCLPMVIQIPVFFALYRVLLGSIELRHAPFMLWITDLSTKDPYYVTPLIMGVTMFLQQKMTPTNMDPTQEKIMLLMPVVFTFMFLNFPAGLVLYWLTNNLLTILQQYLIRRQPD